jgi:type IV secretory pathway VirJ component
MLKKIIVITLAMMWMAIPGHGATEDSTWFGIFNKVKVYRGSPDPAAVVLFISGDGGWNQGVVDMARILASMDAFVVGIDIVRYYAALRKTGHECYYPASDFENLSIFIQKKYKLPGYHKPILAGYSSGATLVYGILAQAPSNTFKGGISLGFCPDIELDKTLCEGAGLKSHAIKPGVSYYLTAEKELSAPIEVLQGMIDQVCDHQHAVDYFNGMKNAEVISLPKVGHGFSVERNWLTQFKEAYGKVLNAPPLFEQNKLVKPVQDDPPVELKSIENLPLMIYPAEPDPSVPMALLISGDGGWTSWDQSLAEEMISRKIPVVALDAQKYFWSRKDPQGVTSDMENILAYYMTLWKKDQFYLIGYSFGADIVPFVATRLKQPWAGELKKLVMLSPDPKADFEIHIADMLQLESSEDVYDVVAEVRKLRNTDILCVFGESEDAAGKLPFGIPGVRISQLPGSHHYSGKFSDLTELICTLGDEKGPR